MQKLRNKIFLTFCAVLLLGTVQIGFCEDVNVEQNPISVQEVELKDQNAADVANPSKTQEEIDKLNEEMGLGEQKSIVVDDIKTSPNDNDVLTKNVVPDTKSELYKMIKMFLKVMFAVAVSTIIIFILLLLTRKFYSPCVTLNKLNEGGGENSGLDTPTNKSEALKTFLNKTKNL